jgi:hypothetical protein
MQGASNLCNVEYRSLQMKWSLLASLLSLALFHPTVHVRAETSAQDPSEGVARAATRSLTVDQWRQDLAFFARELEARHANLYHTISRDRLLAEVAALDQKLAGIREEARLLELARLGALIGDGHTGVFLTSNRLFPNAAVKSLPALPIDFWYEDDRVVVLAAGPGYEWTAGYEVTHVEGQPVARVLTSISRFVSADNDYGVTRNALMYLAIPRVLHGLGISPADSVRLTLNGPADEGREVTVQALPWEDTRNLSSHIPTAANRLVYGDRGTPYWARPLRTENAVYVQVNSWDIGPGEPEDAFARFADSLRSSLSTPERPRLILDFRWNTGGRIEAARHLLTAILAVPHLRDEGKLFAIASSKTFSAGVLFLTDLQRYTNVLVVGTPTAGRVNAYGDLKRFTLPHSGIEVRYSAVHMVRADPWDRRPSIFPDLPAPFTIEAYRDGTDPPLVAIEKYAPRRPVSEAMLSEYRTSGVEGALRKYHELRRSSPLAHEFSEFELKAVADQLIGDGRIEDAVRVLDLNAREYPWIGRVIYQQAEGHLTAGRPTVALERYREAFRLDKRLAEARDRIIELQGRDDSTP